MGLDQYLHAKKYISKSAWNQPTENEAYDKIAESIIPASLSLVMSETMDFQSLEVSVKVMQWRKSNQIHNWFVDNVQSGEDDCKEYYVSRENLADLLVKCIAVVADHSLAEELLPSQDGFFYGSTEYDEYYFTDVQDTLNSLSRLLADPELERWDFSYTSSW